ncbi:MAG: SIMPL domain-containing protein [Gemmatimonadaceae bacterium]
MVGAGRTRPPPSRIGESLGALVGRRAPFRLPIAICWTFWRLSARDRCSRGGGAEQRLGRLGAVMDTALAYRITEMFGPHCAATDVSVTQQDALREATSRARSQAEAMAGAAGAQLGRLVSLSTQGDPSAYYRFGLMEASSDNTEAQPGTAVVAPSVQVTVTVYGRWELLTRP